MHFLATKARRLTIEDYRATPEGAGCQLIDGQLVVDPSPTVHHQSIIWNLSQIFGRHLEKHPDGRAFLAPCDVYLSPHDVVQPDVFFISAARLDILAEDGAHGPPDLVIEVLSPGTAERDAYTKRLLYVKHGVRELWLVDPLFLQIQRYDFACDGAKPVQTIAETERFKTALLPGLTIAAQEVFRR